MAVLFWPFAFFTASAIMAINDENQTAPVSSLKVAEVFFILGMLSVILVLAYFLQEVQKRERQKHSGVAIPPSDETVSLA